jgi:hypothetical protein
MERLLSLGIVVALAGAGRSQSADWTEVIWREPQVRYLLADMTLGGDVAMYRKYATVERDPDSREAIRLWDAGARVVNAADFERKWISNEHGKDGKVLRIVQRGTNRTITGSEALLSTDGDFQNSQVRVILAELTLGADSADLNRRFAEADIAEALRRWKVGARVTNASWFKRAESGEGSRLMFRDGKKPADALFIRLNSDLAYPETNVRYFLADMYLGGSRAFYHRVAESAHEMGCQEAVARFDAGVKVANLDQFERKQVDGKTLITRKGSNERISGMAVKLSSD